jgi:RimJ/RimL family protein N-acetyltransferase
MVPEDSSALFAIYGDPEVMQYASDDPFPNEATVAVMLQSVADLLASGESLEWAIAEQATDRLIGTCGLHSFDETTCSAEVGCMLARTAWSHGYMQEALGALFCYAVEKLGIVLLYADIDTPNQASLRLFTRLGFVQAGETRYLRRF